MEAYLFEKALQEDKPVFGICRGVQLMNVLLVGTLYQDLPTEHPSKTEHHMASPYDRPVHKVTVKEGTLLADIIGAGEHGVNSYHHQAVKDLAPKAEAMAYSEDGLVEAIAVPEKTFIVAMAVGIDRVERLLHSVKREENYYEKESNGYGNGSSNGSSNDSMRRFQERNCRYYRGSSRYHRSRYRSRI